MKSVRRTIPHLHTMSWNELALLIGKGHIDLSCVTEKTDGWTIRVGKDAEGFWSQNSASGKNKMRTGQAYFDRAKLVHQTTGRRPSVQVAQCFGVIHEVLSQNAALLNLLEGRDHVSGEFFYRPAAFPSLTRQDYLCLIGTSYDPLSMGKMGIFWLHSQMQPNKTVSLVEWKKCSNELINFTHDKVNMNVQRIDLKDSMPRFYNMLEFQQTREKVSKHVDSLILPLLTHSKWGDTAPEGIVIHPSPLCKDQPRFKITSEAFRRYREQVKRDGWEHNNRRLASAAG